ncbi:MAG: sugar phosphorylase [Candidatus Helarchaeota archaeon]
MPSEIPQKISSRIQKRLVFLYGEQKASEIYSKLEELMIDFKDAHELPMGRKVFTEEDTILITYGDMVRSAEKSPLRTLRDFLDGTLKGAINTIHFLPFFPYSSDDGFSVIDYMRVNPELGTWDDIDGFKQDYHLMFDAVINHVSRKGKWFQEYLKGNPRYADYFIEVDEGEDLSKVIRPRALPLLTKVETNSGPKFVWTTFSADQIDLNFKSGELLLDIFRILFNFVSHGAELIRLDAIAFIWKEIGTTCLHLPQVHEIVKLFRDVFDYVAPQTVLITETNVPHEENISYFGDGMDEAQMVYQFPLPPLIYDAFTTQSARYLTKWARGLEERSGSTTFFNFTASHDGIGVRPLTGLVPDDHLDLLCETTLRHGGHVSYKTNSDGSKSPYELNISYFDAVNDPNQNEEIDLQVKRFMTTQAIQLSLQGVPGIYFHNIFGTRNYHEGVKETGRYRSINRRKYERKELEEALKDKNSITAKVHAAYKNLLEIRIKQAAFSPQAGQEILDLDDAVFSLIRRVKDGSQAVLGLHNVSNKDVMISIDLKSVGLGDHEEFEDLFSNEKFRPKNGKLDVNFKPYDVIWLRTH